jgi:hypothetical protein
VAFSCGGFYLISFAKLNFEYTKQNCDYASLETLDDIYETAKEFYNVSGNKGNDLEVKYKNNNFLK